MSDCWDKGSQKALCAADISATRTNANTSMVHGTLQRTVFPRLASHFEDFITYVAYVLVSNLALKARDHGGNVSMITSYYIILHHDASGIRLRHATLLETHMPAPSEDMVAAVTNGPAAGIATTSDAQPQIDVLDVERIGEARWLSKFWEWIWHTWVKY